jgi:arginine decarboxylase
MWNITDSIKTYGVERWGAGYFSINKQGHLTVKPSKEDTRSIDVKQVVDALVQKNVSLPIVLRFPQILETQVKLLHESFKNAMTEFNYGGDYMCAYPIKVNQRKEVTEELLRVGKKYNLGLEVGSKAELLIGLYLLDNPHALLICNGYKDDKFIRMALAGLKLGKNVVLVVEYAAELEKIIQISKEMGIRPPIGLRIKLTSKGSGRWEKSGGEAAKFGLSTIETLQCLRMLSNSNMLNCLQMVHFHIGSQITDIEKIQGAVKEAARVYAKLKKETPQLIFLNVGGGLGVDYDGSKTSFDSSINYSIQEYANTVVYTIGEICKSEDVPKPTIITESGRALVAYHSMLVMNVLGEIEYPYDEIHEVKITEDTAHVVKELYDIWQGINAKNYREYYHDALQQKEELFTLFNLGYLSLEDRAYGEILFWEISEKVQQLTQPINRLSEEFLRLRKLLSSKYICNFSVFQSMPDSWAIDHLFPILPIHRLDEEPTIEATLVDLTCDSDGKVDRFIDIREIKETIRLHSLTKDPYYIGVCLLGAYQDVMGDFHNLFGSVNEALIVIDERGNWHIKQIVKGHSVSDMLSCMRYNRDLMQASLQTLMDRLVRDGKLSKEESEKILEYYNNELNGYTYLSS